MMVDRFDYFIKITLGLEQGFSDRENDRGGATRWGITEETARRNGYMGRMEELPIATAYRIFRAEYYKRPKFDLIENPALSFFCFDFGVTSGPGTAIKYLQRAFNVINHEGRYGEDLLDDGGIGPKTLQAINNHPNPERLFNTLKVYRGRLFVNIAEKDKTQRENVGGWIEKRLNFDYGDFKNY